MMYIYIMRRTQIFLSEMEAHVLAQKARATGRTRSSLIREAISQTFLKDQVRSTILQAIARSAGCWHRRSTGAQVVDRMRSGRLARIVR